MNSQPVEHRTQADEAPTIDIVSIFATIQGEGPNAGTPAVFVRLAGCNLRCPGCDTDYTTGRRAWPIEDIVQRCSELVVEPPSYVTGLSRQRRPLIVITGGEPFRQSALGILTRCLFDEDYDVQIESNCTFNVDYYPAAAVVCSPKTPIISETMHPWIVAYKYVIDAAHVDPNDGLPTAVLDNVETVLGVPKPPARPHPGFTGRVYLQPMDAKDPLENKRNMIAAVDSCLKHGYTLCLQLHKIAGIP